MEALIGAVWLDCQVPPSSYSVCSMMLRFCEYGSSCVFCGGEGLVLLSCCVYPDSRVVCFLGMMLDLACQQCCCGGRLEQNQRTIHPSSVHTSGQRGGGVESLWPLDH